MTTGNSHNFVITGFTVKDIRFPTSRNLDGSDAMNTAPDYSAAYVIFYTDSSSGLEGHGLTFTIGRGNDLCVAAIKEIAQKVVGRTFDSIASDMGGLWYELVGDSQLRWLGPEKGVMHLSTAAVVNALWDLYAKAEHKPLWKLLVDMTPEELVACVPFRYIEDALTQEETLKMLKKLQGTRNMRETEIKKVGFPAYTTAAGWLGYSDEKIRTLCREAMAHGWNDFKLKVGADIKDDIRRAKIIREEIGPNRKLMVDANQVWGVTDAIKNMHILAEYNPYWIEEPTNPDDILGHAAISKAITPIGVATGEHCHNRVMFKQFFQTDAMKFCQLDTFRLGGVNEVLAVILMAAKFKIPVCPHGGGVGLSESALHISLFDYICVSGSLENRILEYVGHLHEHFLDPVTIKNGRYLVPEKAGYSSEMYQKSLNEFEFPQGKAWTS
ncbi:MAG: L-fuconate dehydratase [Parcubacteria group bacterium]|nr:L-fuconate dehydratase [Parcubacteria group bacterium]